VTSGIYQATYPSIPLSNPAHSTYFRTRHGDTHATPAGRRGDAAGIYSSATSTATFRPVTRRWRRVVPYHTALPRVTFPHHQLMRKRLPMLNNLAILCLGLYPPPPQYASLFFSGASVSPRRSQPFKRSAPIQIPLGQRALSRPTIAQLWMPIVTFSRRALFADDAFGAVALVDTNILVFTAILRPPNRWRAVLCFRAVGRLRCISSHCIPPSNGALTMGPSVGRSPKPSLSPTSFPSDLVRRRMASPLRWYASSSRSSRNLSVAFLLSVVGPPKKLPRKRLGLRCFYFRA
jgi:hypothetical protein